MKGKFLIADVGATKVLLFLARYEDNKLDLLKKQTYFCFNYPSLENLLSVFLKGEEEVFYAVIAVAGVVNNRKSHLTNLRWTVDAIELEKKLSFLKAIIVNDLELIGYSLCSLKTKDLMILQKGKDIDSKIKTIISVGTGLGEVIVIEDKVLASEGGHVDYAAATDLEIAFLQFIKKKHNHVSYERILSGDGILNVYEFFSGSRKITTEEIFKQESKESRQTVSFFLQTLGKEAGNLALKTLSFGGVYLFGGVCQKNQLLLQKEEFLEGFCNKGRFSYLLKQTPVYLIKTEEAALTGGLNLLLKNQN